MRGRGVSIFNPHSERNEWLPAKTGHCLSALRIVEKEQALTRCLANAKQRQFKNNVLLSYP
jgi:hypothetical protein